MFASRQVNTDPMPWIDAFGHGRFAHQRYERDEHLPRPEFNNTPNPVLLDFRANRGATGPWLNEITPGQHHTEFLREVGKAWDVPVTAEHIVHARKVLTRLAAFRGVEVA